ncbi:MAG: hypothetical protein V3T23_08405 [Nitrososphaerales archaeon]
MAIATNPGPFSGDGPNPNRNRIRRITISIGGVKTAAHLDHQKSGSVAGYEKVRDDSLDPNNIQTTERSTFITEEE